MRKYFVLATAALFLCVAADARRLQDSEILVVGRAGTIKAGFWEITQDAPRIVGGRSSGRPERKWNICLPSENNIPALQALLESVDQPAGMMTCSQLRTNLKGQTVDASKRCSSPGLDWQYRYSGKIQNDRITMVQRTILDSRRGTTSEGSTRINARFAGECPGAGSSNDTPRPQSSHAHVDPPILHGPPPPAALHPVVPPSSDLPRDAFPSLPAHRNKPGPTGDNARSPTRADSDEIVVTGTRFRNLRLAFTARGTQMRHCQIVRSSGRKDFDRDGCFALRQCVAEGNVATVDALPCVNKRMNRLYPPTGGEHSGGRRD